MSRRSLSQAWPRRTLIVAAALPAVAAGLAGAVSSAPASTTPLAARSTPTTTTATGSTPGTTPAGTTPPAGTSTVSASIAYRRGEKGKPAVWMDIRVSISVGGTVLLRNELLPEGARDSTLTAPKLRAVDLDGDGASEVTIDVFTTGAACCRRTVVYHRRDDTYRPQVLDWGDAGYRLTDLTGTKAPEFRTADARVPAFWGSRARGPLRLLALRDGRVRDISRRARRELSRDLRLQRDALRAVRRTRGADPRPVIAAYVADLVRLGDLDGARATIRIAAKRGELRTTAARFGRTLDRQFLRWGYTTRRNLLTRSPERGAAPGPH